jgi:hypothetical protein
LRVRWVTLELPATLALLEGAWEFGQGPREALFESREALDGVGVGLSLGLQRDVGGDDEVNLFADVVEGQDFVEEEQAGVGDVQLVGGGCGQLFDLADDVIAEEADGSGGEGRQAGNAGRGVSAERFAEDGEDVAFDLDGLFAFGDGDGGRGRRCACKG